MSDCSCKPVFLAAGVNFAERKVCSHNTRIMARTIGQVTNYRTDHHRTLPGRPLSDRPSTIGQTTHYRTGHPLSDRPQRTCRFRTGHYRTDHHRTVPDRQLSDRPPSNRPPSDRPPSGRSLQAFDTREGSGTGKRREQTGQNLTLLQGPLGVTRSRFRLF